MWGPPPSPWGDCGRSWEQLGKKMEISIRIQREEIFDRHAPDLKGEQAPPLLARGTLHPQSGQSR